MLVFYAPGSNLYTPIKSSRLLARSVILAELLPEPASNITSGGPGGGTDPTDRGFFNPEKYKVNKGTVFSTPTIDIFMTRSFSSTNGAQANQPREFHSLFWFRIYQRPVYF